MNAKSALNPSLNSRLAACSATAIGALVAAPTTGAAVHNITGLDVTLSFEPNQSMHINFTAGHSMIMSGTLWAITIPCQILC